jgi:hypothetical protein
VRFESEEGGGCYVAKDPAHRGFVGSGGRKWWIMCRGGFEEWGTGWKGSANVQVEPERSHGEVLDDGGLEAIEDRAMQFE